MDTTNPQRDTATPEIDTTDSGIDTTDAQNETPRFATDREEWAVEPGTDVVDSQGHHVGRVDDIQDGYLVVRKGRFFASDYYVPFGAIASHDDTTIYLNVTADDEATQIWHQRPSATMHDERSEAGPTAMDTEERLEFLTDQEGNVRVPVIREELAATRRPVVRGSVRIETTVTEHEETLEVPVTEERVRIQRRRFEKDGTGSDITVDGGTFEIPFYGEDVDLEKRVRVIEEIVITREAVETVRRVRGMVRHEDVQIDEAGVPEDNLDPDDLARDVNEPTAAEPAERRETR